MESIKTTSFVEAIPKPLLIAITLPFLALTLFASYEFGLIGIFKEGLKNSATTQILIDLFLCGGFFIAWLYQDAKRMERSFILWTVITLAVGSFGPLFYLITRKKETSHAK